MFVSLNNGNYVQKRGDYKENICIAENIIEDEVKEEEAEKRMSTRAHISQTNPDSPDIKNYIHIL